MASLTSIPIKVTIDSNCINTKGNIDAVNTLERWASEGKINFLATERLMWETAQYKSAAHQKAIMLRHIGEPLVYDVGFYDTGAYFSERRTPSFDDFAGVLFPDKDPSALSEKIGKQDVNDVMHLLSHHEAGGDVFVTLNTRDFIADGRRERLEKYHGVLVMTPDELVERLQKLHRWT